MARTCKKIFAGLLLLGFSLCSFGQQSGENGSVPTSVNFSGVLNDSSGKPLNGAVGVTFYLYKDQQRGSPLWMETQNVSPDETGHYSVTLGSTTSQGLPKDLFSTGQARWLGVQAQGQAEQARVMLLSVPYAIKAGDAATVGGLPPSAFMLAAPGSTPGPTSASAPSQAGGPNVGGSGTENYIPIWTDNSGDLGNSVLYQTGSGSSARIGINLKSPLAALDVNGTGLMRGLFEMATTGFATATKAYNSNPFNFESSAFNSGSGKYSLNHFQWQAEPIGNNGTKPGATLNLLYGTDPAAPVETGLNIAGNGQITFAAGQTFPGTGNGTITGVGAGAGLSGGGNSGNVSLGVASGGIINSMLQNPALTITAGSGLSGGGSVALGGSTTLSLNSNQIPFLNTNNNFTGTQSASVNALTAAIAGTNSFTITGLQQVPVAVSGLATGGSQAVGAGVYGAGVGQSTEGQNTILNLENRDLFPSIGIWGDAAGFSLPNGELQLPIGLLGTVDIGYAVAGYNNSSVLPTAIFENDGGGPTAPILQTYGPKSGGGSCSIDGSGNLSCTGTASPVVAVDNGSRKVALYGVASAENWFEDFGSGQLSNGSAVITFESTFAQTVNTGVDYHVFLTPNGDSHGLYVSAKTANSFEVREQDGGTSNIAFDYRIVARRKGYENVRLADKTNALQRPTDRKGNHSSPHSRDIARR